MISSVRMCAWVDMNTFILDDLAGSCVAECVWSLSSHADTCRRPHVSNEPRPLNVFRWIRHKTAMTG